MVIMWLAGIVISEGFWSCLFSIIIPVYAWYLVTEKVMVLYGVV